MLFYLYTGEDYYVLLSELGLHYLLLLNNTWNSEIFHYFFGIFLKIPGHLFKNLLKVKCHDSSNLTWTILVSTP